MSLYNHIIDLKYAEVVTKIMNKKKKNRWRLIQDNEDTYIIKPPKTLNSSSIHKFKRDFHTEYTFNFYFKFSGTTKKYIDETDRELLTRVKRKFIEIVTAKSYPVDVL